MSLSAFSEQDVINAIRMQRSEKSQFQSYLKTVVTAAAGQTTNLESGTSESHAVALRTSSCSDDIFTVKLIFIDLPKETAHSGHIMEEVCKAQVVSRIESCTGAGRVETGVFPVGLELNYTKTCGFDGSGCNVAGIPRERGQISWEVPR